MPFYDRFGVVVVPDNRIAYIRAGLLGGHRSSSSVLGIASIVDLYWTCRFLARANNSIVRLKNARALDDFLLANNPSRRGNGWIA